MIIYKSCNKSRIQSISFITREDLNSQQFNTYLDCISDFKVDIYNIIDEVEEIISILKTYIGELLNIYSCRLDRFIIIKLNIYNDMSDYDKKYLYDTLCIV